MPTASVLVAPSAELAGPAAMFAKTLGLTPRVAELMRERIEQRVGKPWSAFDVTMLAPALSAPLLVVPDRVGTARCRGQHGRLVAHSWGRPGGGAGDPVSRPSPGAARCGAWWRRS